MRGVHGSWGASRDRGRIARGVVRRLGRAAHGALRHVPRVAPPSQRREAQGDAQPRHGHLLHQPLVRLHPQPAAVRGADVAGLAFEPRAPVERALARHAIRDGRTGGLRGCVPVPRARAQPHGGRGGGAQGDDRHRRGGRRDRLVGQIGADIRLRRGGFRGGTRVALARVLLDKVGILGHPGVHRGARLRRAHRAPEDAIPRLDAREAQLLRVHRDAVRVVRGGDGVRFMRRRRRQPMGVLRLWFVQLRVLRLLPAGAVPHVPGGLLQGGRVRGGEQVLQRDGGGWVL